MIDLVVYKTIFADDHRKEFHKIATYRMGKGHNKIVFHVIVFHNIVEIVILRPFLRHQ